MAIVPICGSAGGSQKERYLTSIESQTTELVSYARKVEQDIEARYYELTGEQKPPSAVTQTNTTGTFQSIQADLRAVSEIITNIEKKFGSL